MFISENDIIGEPKLVDFVYDGVISWIRHRLDCKLGSGRYVLPTLYSCPFYNIAQERLESENAENAESENAENIDNRVVLMKKLFNSGYLDGKTILVLNDSMYSSSVIHYNSHCNKWKFDGHYLLNDDKSEGIENNAMFKYIGEEDGSNLYFDMCCIRSMEKLENNWARYIKFIDIIKPFLVVGWGKYACRNMYFKNEKKSSVIDALFMYKLHEIYLGYYDDDNMPLFLSLLR